MNVIQHVNRRVTLSGSQQSVYHDGSPVNSGVQYEYSKSERVATIEKSPLTKNPVINGWRKPSPYYLRSEELDPGYWFAKLEHSNTRSKTTREGFGQPGLVSNTYYNPPLSMSMMRTASQSTRSVVMRDESIRNARNNVAARAFQLSSSLLEAKSSVQGLGRLATSVADSYLGIRLRSAKRVFKALGHPKGRDREFKTLKRVLRRTAVDTPQGFSNALLTVEWGLKPIIDDMVGVAAFLSDDSKFYFVNGVGHSGKQMSTVLKPQKQASPIGAGLGLRAHTPATQKWGYRTSLWFEVSSESLRGLTKYGLSDLPTALWAVVPWSFLVDWVLPVSQYLSSLTATYGLKWKGGTTTFYSELKAKCVYSFVDDYPSGTLLAFEGKPMNGKLFEMDREVHTSEPLGLIPTIRDPFGAYQAVMSLALIGSRIPKIKNI